MTPFVARSEPIETAPGAVIEGIELRVDVVSGLISGTIGPHTASVSHALASPDSFEDAFLLAAASAPGAVDVDAIDFEVEVEFASVPALSPAGTLGLGRRE